MGMGGPLTHHPHYARVWTLSGKHVGFTIRVPHWYRVTPVVIGN
jgi:hypothetical protein